MPSTEIEENEVSASTSTERQTKNKTVHGFASLEDFSKQGLKEIITATKCVSELPQAESRDLYCGYPTFCKIIDEQSDRVLGLISKVLKAHNIRGNIQRRQMDEQFEMLQECNDIIFESLNTNLDVMAGINRNVQTPIVLETQVTRPQQTIAKAASVGSWNTGATSYGPGFTAARLITAKNIERPQVKFQKPVDNSVLNPFVPKLKEKPNSLKPLAILPEYDEHGNIYSYLHPYEFELLKFVPPIEQLGYKDPILPRPIETTELCYVDTIPKLQKALEELRQFKEVAIDVEHHSYRTFMGITCLLQISTREKDYIFDALALREDLHVLNAVLTDPKVVKVLHGAFLDIEWLQRDLSLYIVNMFDTHQAAKLLNLSRLSLSFLLKHYLNIEVDKTFQLADWRMRPLPVDLINYARQDTHSLIYIYERITNDLLDLEQRRPTLLNVVYQRSTDICMKRYIKPQFTNDSHLDVLRKAKRVFDNRQLSALRDIFHWRDVTARQEDESYGYVLPNHMMLQIADSLPREMQGILACCNPIPPPVRQHLHTLHQIILRAREQPLMKPILEPDNIVRLALSNAKDFNNKLYCPHDFTHIEEFRDDLPTLLKFNNSNNLTTSIIKPDSVLKFKSTTPAIRFFNKTEQPQMEATRKHLTKMENKFLRMPFKRYRAILPLAEQEKRAEAVRIEIEMKKRQLCPAPSLSIKQEPENEHNNEDDLYRLPLKEQLKRKHNGDLLDDKNFGATEAKREKTSTPKDDKLKFLNVTGSTQPRNTEQSNTLVPNTSNVKVECIDVETDSDGPPTELPTSSHAPPISELTTNRKEQRVNSRSKFKNRNQVQSSNKPIKLPPTKPAANFDYKQVDFRQFRGGAQRAKGTELKPHFRGKNNPNKANSKKFNKLFTFSNVKNKK